MSARAQQGALPPSIGERALPDRRVVLRPEPQAAGAAREFVRTSCALWGLQPPDAAMLVISELVTNAVSHGQSSVTVSLRLSADHLLVEVEDDNPRPPVLHQPGWEALGGRGLLLVETLSRPWGSTARPLGKVVWADVPVDV